MAGNPFTIVSNDPRPARITGVARHEMQEAQGGASTDDKNLEDESGPVMSFGRGASDTLITYIALYRDGVKYYVYVDSLGTGLVVTSVKP